MASDPRPKMFPKDYWNRPPEKEQGEASPQPIYEAVGEVLSHWETAEEALAALFMVLTESATAKETFTAVKRAYGSIETSAGRRRATEAAAEIYLGPMWEKKSSRARELFDQVMEAAACASRRRDDIAHGRVMRLVKNEENIGMFLVPPDYNTGRNHPYPTASPEDQAIFTRHVDGHTTQGLFRYVADDILDFAVKFVELREKVLRYIPTLMRGMDDKYPMLEDKFLKNLFGPLPPVAYLVLSPKAQARHGRMA
jgi:hypothetical protein